MSGALGTFSLQSSVVSPRRLGRAGLKDSCSGPGGDVWILRGGFGQLTFQSRFIAQLGHGLGGGLGFRHERAFFATFEAGSSSFLSLFVDGGLEQCRAVAKRWYLA